ncbi:MAG: hypothetical protein ACI841_004869, partial [Planctomycetota bacterium]
MRFTTSTARRVRWIVRTSVALGSMPFVLHVACAEDEQSAYATGTPAAILTTAELDGDADEELIFIGMRGELRVLAPSNAAAAEIGESAEPSNAASQTLIMRGAEQTLPHPAYSLVMCADVLERGSEQLVVLDESGLKAYVVDEGAGFATEVVSLSTRAKLKARTTKPLLSPFLRDVNGDEHVDLLVPDPGGLELWLSAGPQEGGGPPRFSRVARIDSEAQVSSSSNTRLFSDRLRSSLRIPDLNTEDLNGDGRDDIVVSRGDRHAFHMQTEDGRFPSQPDVRLNLEIFEDRSPRPAMRPGEIVSPDDNRQFTRRDLNGDGIPDYVIAHRRKVWVFHGGDAGPQFREPAQVLIVAEDITGLLILSLDEDEYPDLLMLKVEIPAISSLLTGLLANWSIDVRAIGYRNELGERFDTKPKWRRDLEMSLPPILEMVRHPERFEKKFEGVEDKFRMPYRGDFDGDGRLDMVMADEAGESVGLWAATEDNATEGESERKRGEQKLAHLLFGDK